IRGPNCVVVATAGAGAFAATPQCAHRQAKRRWRITYGLTGGISISSYSPIRSASASNGKVSPHCSQTLGMWSRNSSGSSESRRLCGSCPSFAPPGREFSRFSFLSVEGGLDDVREVLSGRWSRSTNSINCSLLSCCKSLRSIAPWIQRSRLMARGWVIASNGRLFLLWDEMVKQSAGLVLRRDEVSQSAELISHVQRALARKQITFLVAVP